MREIKKAIELFDKGLYKKALKYFNSKLKDTPLDDLIWKYKGETLAKLGNFKEAINCYNKAIEILPDYMTESLWILKGKALIKSSEYDHAIDCFNYALKVKPDSETAKNEKETAIKLKIAENKKQAVKSISKKNIVSWKQQIAENKKQAVKSVSKKLSSDPIELLRNRIVQRENNDEFKQKIREFEQEIKKNPNNSNLWSDMGNQYLRLEKYDLAIKCYNEALKLDPTQFFYKLNKGSAYLLSERYHNAVECYQEALSMNPNDLNLKTILTVAMKKVAEMSPSIYDYDKLEEYLKNFSQSSINFHNRGLEALNMHQYDRALNFFDEALRINDKDANALFQKGNTYYFQSEFKEAIRYFNQIIELNPDLPSLMFELWVNKGICHRRIGEGDYAINCYKKALEINPKDFETFYNMGNILSDLDRLEEAIESYNTAIKLASEVKFASPKMMGNKGLVLARMKRYKEALQIMDIAIEIDPIKPLLWFVKGLAHKGLNESEKALECFNKSLRFNPNLALALYEKANLLYDLKEYREAIVCYDALSSINPSLIVNEQKKIKLIRKLIKEEGSEDKYFKWYEKGVEALNSKEYANAILHFDKCLDFDLNNANVWFGISEAYNYLKRFEYAEQCLNKSRQLNPNNPNLSKIKLGHVSIIEPGIFHYLSNPITGLKVEGHDINEKCTRALRIFRPYLILNNSNLKIVIIDNKVVRIGIIGDLNILFAPPHPIYADIESLLHTIEPTLNIVIVKYV